MSECLQQMQLLKQQTSESQTRMKYAEVVCVCVCVCRMLTYADVRVQTYAAVCCRMLSYAGVC
jgi:hypothetical protein